MKQLLLLCSAALALTFSGCATTGITTNPYGLWQPSDKAVPGPTPIGPPIHQPPVGNDPVVVDAEKTLIIARDTFNLYVHLEDQNHDALLLVSSKFYEGAEKVRRDARGWLKKADVVKETYKHNRTTENKASLFTALATVSKLMSETQTLIAESGLKGP